MKLEKHTAGPWKVCSLDLGPGGRHFHVRDSQDCLVGDSLSIQDANLISAAPELLEAAKEAMTLLEPFLQEPGRAIFWKLVQAVKKAEGKS